MREQNYRNHRHFDPTTYFFLLPLVLLLIAAIVVEWVEYVNASQTLWNSISMTSIELTVLILSFRVRSYALIAQDRAIRAEEQIRHYVLTGQALDTRLTIQQIVALRFASDAEFPALARRAVGEQLPSDAIKQAIVNWRSDWYRV